MMKNIRFVILYICLLFGTNLLGQTVKFDIDAVVVNDYEYIKVGKNVNFVAFCHVFEPTEKGDIREVYYLEDAQGNRIDINKNLDDCFDFKYENIQDFWNSKIVSSVLYNIKKKGFQYELRKEMENDALEYIGKVKSYGLELNDPYLENYIYGLICKIAPTYYADGRQTNLNLLIQQNPTIDACLYPNGTIVLNTGLLSVLHTEDELVAILAHEIAHFVLDHSIINVNKKITRQKRAAFWSSVAVGVTAMAEGTLAATTDYCVPGTATYGVAALSTLIGAQVLDRLGMKFNHEQEDIADKYAISALEMLGYDKNALSSALSRIGNQQLVDRNSVIYCDSYTHPALMERIRRTGTPNDFRNKHFEQMVSFAVTSVASMEYGDRRFNQCLLLLSQNISNGVATADDYLLKANCLLATRTVGKEADAEIAQAINNAKLLDAENLNIYKSEIIFNLRLGKKYESVILLNEFLDKLYKIKVFSERDYVLRQIDWAKRMLIKLNGMTLN